MKLVKVLLVAAAVLAIAGGLFWHIWLKDQVAYAKVSTAYAAKMVCSCRFVAERELESCKQDFTADVSAVTFTEEEESVRATVLGGVVASEARFEPGLGCTLVEN